jgi:hypothetical protein
MAIEFEDFYSEFFQDILTSADGDGRYLEDSFFEHFCSYLVDAGDLETADRAQHLSARGVRVDGYGGDPLTNDGVLSLIISDFNQSAEVDTLIASEMDAIFKRLQNFLTKSLDESFRDGLEETSPAFGLADLIASRWSTTTKVRLFLISNRRLSARVDGRDAESLNDVPVTYSVWDIGRLHRYVAAGQVREEIEIDLEKDFGQGLLALPAHMPDAGYEAYLIAIPGSQLAAIYDRWGSRLLEQNVRVFLQARGEVNKGIRNTIENDPAMFFAYNNGITATAEKLTTRKVAGATVVTSLSNLQIVNGGQTTASIHAANRKKVDLSAVFVQMKLSIVDPAKAMEVVPKISEYANSQNRVNAADFFANHPFHVRMEGFSRRMFQPSADGSFLESKWFYERARGQYQDARGLLTVARRRKFDLEFPKRQVFAKTDLAKYVMVWRGYPEIVSRGAQKNFGEFAKLTGSEWTKQPDVFNEAYYQQTIAMAIIFQRTEKLVTDQPWYQGGYRANIVAYAIAKIAHDVSSLGRAADFDQVWRSQKLSEQFEEAIRLAAQSVQEVLVNPPAGTRNVTEWAKNQACWSRVKALNLSWPKAWVKELITADEHREGKKAAVKDQRMLNGIEAQTLVIKAGGALWDRVKEWGVSKSLLLPIEVGVLDVAAKIPNRIPSEKQSQIVIAALKKLRAEGCQIGSDLL